ncbi:MAG: type II secretion system secretin GspD [Deltaproteobacteria bacterium]|nr:type II secretion system secretin GspD [Deltaproteobacteria bacterium]
MPPEQPPVVGPPEQAPPPERRVQRPAPPPPDKRVERPAPPPEIRERPRPTPAPVEEAPDERYVTIDFDDVDIALFIKFISELTGKNFVVDKAVRGKVTIISPTKISVKEAYKVFESVLEVHGFTTIPSGSVVKIVPAVQARSKNIETRLREEAIDPEDKVVTQLIPLEYANPDQLKKLFAPLISKSSVMVSYPPTGMLIVTDVLSNIKRLFSIVEVIDVVGIGQEITVVPLEHATATVIAKSVTTVFQAKARTKGAPVRPSIKVVADERTNSLIIAATEDDTLKVRQLVKLLDREVPRGEGDIRVYYLQNANSEDLAQVLTALPSKQQKAMPKGKAPVISKEVQIVADKATNSLVITANRDDYLILEDVIEKLDIPRRMVYIEALLMEVSVDKRLEIGVRWHGVDEIGSYNDRTVGGFASSVPPNVNIPTLDPITATGIFPPGFSVGVLGEAIEIGGIKFPNLLAVVNAFQNDADVHIISTPQIMTMDNEEAEIIVADNIPFLTRQETTSANIDYSSYEFKDVGTTLRITPQINQERFVRLEIFNQLAQVVEQERVGLPTTLKREARTTVVIKDGHTVVIGGLIDETMTQSTYKTPCLGDVPFFGWLFKSKLDDNDRTNLFIFITPHIVENPMEADVIYEDKKEHIDRVRMKEGVIKMYEKPAPEDEKTEADGTEAAKTEGEKTESEPPDGEKTESELPEGEKIESEKTE